MRDDAGACSTAGSSRGGRAQGSAPAGVAEAADAEAQRSRLQRGPGAAATSPGKEMLVDRGSGAVAVGPSPVSEKQRRRGPTVGEAMNEVEGEERVGGLLKGPAKDAMPRMACQRW